MPNFSLLRYNIEFLLLKKIFFFLIFFFSNSFIGIYLLCSSFTVDREPNKGWQKVQIQ